MHVTLQISEGPAAGGMISVQPGQNVSVGRGTAADFAIAGDLELSGKHFEVGMNGDLIVLRDLESTNGSFLNGRPVTGEIDVQHGDKIEAGGSVFMVAVLSDEEAALPAAAPTIRASHAPAPVLDTAAMSASDASTLDLPETDDDGFLAFDAKTICTEFKIEFEEFEESPPPNTSPAEFVSSLRDQGFLVDALRFMSAALPKRKAVWWTCRSVRDGAAGEFPAEDTAALEAAENWVIAPSDETSRLASPAAEATEFATAAGWSAMAAFWSGSSMTPPDNPVVPPGIELTSKAVGGALLLAAVADETADPAENQRRFLDDGFAVAKGEGLWQSSPT